MAQMRKVHIWCPGLFGQKGGIEAYSAFLIDALAELRPDVTFSVFVKNDSARYLRGRPRHQGTGNVPRALRTFVFSALVVGRAFLDRPDLIVTTHLNFSPVARWLNRFFRIPYWVVAHGVEAWKAGPEMLPSLTAAYRVVAVSSFTANVLITEVKVPADNVCILPNTFDQTKFVPGPKPLVLLQRYGIDESQPTLLTVGRLSAQERHKGYDRILEALPRVRQSVPNVHYILAGAGDDVPRVQELIRKYDLENCVTLTGYVEDRELCDHYNLCDAFVMLSKWEGFGIVFLEALACGKPVLAGNRDGSQDAVCHGELGLLIDPFDVDKIAATLIDLLQKRIVHPFLYEPLQLREKVISAYGYERFKRTLSDHLGNFQP